MIEFTDDQLMLLYQTARQACCSQDEMARMDWTPVYNKIRDELIRRMKERKNT